LAANCEFPDEYYSTCSAPYLDNSSATSGCSYINAYSEGVSPS
jgi:hypothetical protein